MILASDTDVTLTIVNSTLKERRFLLYQKDAELSENVYVYAWDSMRIPSGGKWENIKLPNALQAACRLESPRDGSILGDAVAARIGGSYVIQGPAGSPPSIAASQSDGREGKVSIANQSGYRLEAAVLKGERPLLGRNLAVGDVARFQPASSFWVATSEEYKRGDRLDPAALTRSLAVVYAPGNLYTVTATEDPSTGSILFSARQEAPMPWLREDGDALQ